MASPRCGAGSRPASRDETSPGIGGAPGPGSAERAAGRRGRAGSALINRWMREVFADRLRALWTCQRGCSSGRVGARVLTMRTGLALQDARDDFDRARRQASLARLAGWLRGRPASRNRLPVLGAVRTIAGAAGPGVRRLVCERISGLGACAEVMVPIDQIVGTVEPTRSRCFDRRFRPTSEVPRTRFERIAADIRSGRGMDPVDLYRYGGRYYVLDGHHRIAVARALGERLVSANVTDVRLGDPSRSPSPDQNARHRAGH
jgi:hypothetical protein